MPFTRTFGALTSPIPTSYLDDNFGQLVDSTSSSNGDALIATKRTATGGSASTVHAYLERQVFDAREFGAACDGTTDDTTALAAAITAATTGRNVVTWVGTLKVTSQITVPAGVVIVGRGHTTDNSIRGSTCLLRAFTGSNPTIAFDGDDSGAVAIDVDNNNQGTGDAIRVWGSRVHLTRVSARKSGGDNVRVGRTNSGASSTNSNLFRFDMLVCIGAAAAGLRLDDTNTTTSTSYPLGLANCNAGVVIDIDCRSNGTDGIQIGNANDNTFIGGGSQSNTGCGIRCKTDGTNYGPRANCFINMDVEANTGNDIQFDAGTLPAAASGGYNRVIGNRSVAVNPRIVDNGTCNYVLRWDANPAATGVWHTGPVVSAVNAAAAGSASFDAYADTNYIQAARFQGRQGTGSGGKAVIQTKRNGNTPVDRVEIDQVGRAKFLFASAHKRNTLTYSASITPDVDAGDTQVITVTNATAFTINAPSANPGASEAQRVTFVIRNTSGGAMGAITWNAVYKLAAFTNPGNGNSRSIEFEWDGTNYVQRYMSAADVPN